MFLSTIPEPLFPSLGSASSILFQHLGKHTYRDSFVRLYIQGHELEFQLLIQSLTLDNCGGCLRLDFRTTVHPVRSVKQKLLSGRLEITCCFIDWKWPGLDPLNVRSAVRNANCYTNKAVPLGVVFELLIYVVAPSHHCMLQTRMFISVFKQTTRATLYCRVQEDIQQQFR